MYKYCPDCGTKNLEENNLCKNCGKSLQNNNIKKNDLEKNSLNNQDLSFEGKLGLLEKLKLWVSAYFIIWRRQGDVSIWGYQFLILGVGLFAFLIVFGLFMGLDSLLGITDRFVYYSIFWGITPFISIIVGVISALRMSYEIVSRGWI